MVLQEMKKQRTILPTVRKFGQMLVAGKIRGRILGRFFLERAVKGGNLETVLFILLFPNEQ
jgi:hypothetical protein